jgi:hypothetical protein
MNQTKPRGRPKGSTNKQFSLTSYADKPELITLPKTETAQLKELKNLLINSAGTRVVHKAVEIALNDEHPAQLAAIKLCLRKKANKGRQSRSILRVSGKSPMLQP